MCVDVAYKDPAVCQHTAQVTRYVSEKVSDQKGCSVLFFIRGPAELDKGKTTTLRAVISAG